MPTSSTRVALTLATAVALTMSSAGTDARERPQAGREGGYQAVKACSLLSLADMKKLAPWPPQFDASARAEEEEVEVPGSGCGYPGVGVQIVQFNRAIIETARRSGPLESVAGVGEEAYVKDNGGRFANLYAKVGPHLLLVQLGIEGKTFASSKATLLEIGKAFAAKLR